MTFFFFCLCYLLVGWVCFVLTTVLFFVICSFLERILFHPLPHKHNKQHLCSTSKPALFLYRLKTYNIAIICQKTLPWYHDADRNLSVVNIQKGFALQPGEGNQHFLWSKSRWWDESLKCWDQSQNSENSQRSTGWPNKALIFSCKLGDTCFVKMSSGSSKAPQHGPIAELQRKIQLLGRFI